MSFLTPGKGKVHHTPLESIGGCTFPSPRPWSRKWRTTNVCDTWAVWRQTYSYLPSHKATLPFCWYQIILLGDKNMCANKQCAQGCTQQDGGQDLNLQPVDLKSNIVTTRPPSRTWNRVKPIAATIIIIIIYLFAHKSTITTSNKISETEQDSKAH